MASPANAMLTDPKTGISLPSEGEIEQAVPSDWSGVDLPFEDAKRAFARLDSSPDSLFYSEPRFVEHVDENAVRLLTDYVSNVAIQRGDAVLDLCSSWTSHIAAECKDQTRRVAGLGMNAKELSVNPSLTEYTVRDLNQNTKLPYEDGSFDVVLCQLSIDYLTRPLEVLAEVGRVLRRGGRAHILFSNRLFLSKAVAIWTGADDIDHVFTVAAYLHFSGGDFQNIRAIDLSTRKGRERRIVGDPIYCVTATKGPA